MRGWEKVESEFIENKKEKLMSKKWIKNTRLTKELHCI
jgi:hypothetical protein